MELYFLIAVILLLAGVVTSFVPMIPGALLSIAGVTLYYWSTGFTEPNLFLLVLMYLTSIMAFGFDVFAGAIGSKIGGASDKTVQMAAIAGLLFFFVGGPIGSIIGIAAVVFLREYLITGKTAGSSKASIYTVLSVLGSSLVQAAFTGLTLIIFLAGIVL